MAYKFLVVEDSAQIREMIGDYFAAKSGGEIELDFAQTGDIGLEKIYACEYDLVLLDIMLPGASGFEICRQLRSKSGCPIIFITALGRQDDILHGYELGADDYIVKPFSLAPKVYFLLKLLMDNKDRVMSRDTIITKVWGYDFDGDERVVDNHIKKLRKALGSESKRVRTVFGGGYKLTEA